MVLALIGAPAAPMSYAAYQALKAGGGALGAVLEASEATAIAGLLGTTALAVGAGVGGFLLGQAILRNLQRPETMPQMGEFYEASSPTGFAEIRYDYYNDDVKVIDAQISQRFSTPAKGIFKALYLQGTLWFMLDAANQRVNIIFSDGRTTGTSLKILEFLTEAGDPLPPTSRLPSYVPTRPDAPKPSLPVPIPVPGLPPFPITPVVIPNPGNEPGEDNEERPPGVIVQIPQTGQQITFAPDGVRISNYANPSSRPFVVPQAPILPGAKIATPQCCDGGGEPPPPCDLTEVICRIKTLQKEILNDGTNRLSGQTPNAQSAFYEELAGDFHKVVLTVTERPANLRIQPSTPPASDVWYVGWFAWVENGFPTERQPIHFQDQNFLAPPNVTGFVYQVNQGCKAIATWQRRTKREYIDMC